MHSVLFDKYPKSVLQKAALQLTIRLCYSIHRQQSVNNSDWPPDNWIGYLLGILGNRFRSCFSSILGKWHFVPPELIPSPKKWPKLFVHDFWLCKIHWYVYSTTLCYWREAINTSNIYWPPVIDFDCSDWGFPSNGQQTEDRNLRSSLERKCNFQLEQFTFPNFNQ